MIVTAHEYLRQTQRFLREQKQEFENPDDLMVYINRARREVAGRTQCIRRLTPISGQVVSATVLTGGHGYVSPIERSRHRIGQVEHRLVRMVGRQPQALRCLLVW